MNFDNFLTIILLVILILDELRFHFERQTYLDRIMAKNLPEFKDNAKVSDNDYKDSEDPNIVELEDAREEITNEDGTI